MATGRRGVGRALGIGGTVLGVTGVIALTGTVLSGGTPAYAVSKGADGVVSVSIRDITGVTGANEELRRLGVRAVAVPIRDGQHRVIASVNVAVHTSRWPLERILGELLPRLFELAAAVERDVRATT